MIWYNGVPPLDGGVDPLKWEQRPSKVLPIDGTKTLNDWYGWDYCDYITILDFLE